jgi:hypothetical protein
MASANVNDRRSGASLRFGDIEIEAIERVDVRVDTVGGGIVGVARKEPIAVIVRTPTGEWRIELADEESGW